MLAQVAQVTHQPKHSQALFLSIIISIRSYHIQYLAHLHPAPCIAIVRCLNIRRREGGTGEEGSEMRKERMKRFASRTVIITPAAADTWSHIALAANLGCKCTRTKSAPPSTSTSERGVCRPRRAAGAGAAFSRHVSQRVSCVFGGDRFTYDRRSSSL